MIFVTGDCHIPIDYDKLFTFNKWIKDQNITEEVYLIVCGDFGLLWDGGLRDSTYINKLTKELDYTILWIDGNHENFDLIKTYTISEMFGGKVQSITPKIHRLRRGEIYSIEGNNILTIGGAGSIDKAIRTEGISWWADENITRLDMLNFRTNISKNHTSIDYIITHECPSHITRHISLLCTGNEDKFIIDQNNKYMDEISDKGLGQKIWYFGHYHMDKTFEDFQILPDGEENVTSTYRVLFNEIVRLGDTNRIELE